MNTYLIHTSKSYPMKVLVSGNTPEEAVEKYLPGRNWKYKVVSKDGMDRFFSPADDKCWVQIHML